MSRIGRGHRAVMALTAAMASNLCTALQASAHIIAPQYSVFDNGALHTVLTLQQVVPLLALGAALGTLPQKTVMVCGTVLLTAFTVAALWWGVSGHSLSAYSTPLAFLAGGAALISRQSKVSGWLCGLGSMIIGVHLGGLGQQDAALTSSAPMFALGSGIGAALVVFYAAYATNRFQRPWQIVPARIAGSWLLAIGFMFLGLTLRPPPPPVADDSNLPTATCPGPHKHGPDGEFICLAKSAVPGTVPKAVIRDDAPPNPDVMAPQTHGAGPSVPQ